MTSLKQRCSSLCPVDCKGLRVQQEHFHTQYPRAVSVQWLEHPLREKGGGCGGVEEVVVEGGVLWVDGNGVGWGGVQYITGTVA